MNPLLKAGRRQHKHHHQPQHDREDNSYENSEEEGDLVSFRRWLKALTVDELVQALRFPLMGNTKHNENTTTNDSSEDVLDQLVRKQAPIRTPIHPRAVSYKAATKLGATDGQNEYECIHRLRRTKPRLFQLLEQRVVVPPSATTSSSFRTTRNRFTTKSRQPKNSTRFSVVARKFVTPAGDVWGLGSTQQQREADQILLYHTRYTTTTTTAAAAEKLPTFATTVPTRYCYLSTSSTTTSSASLKTKGDVLKLLRIASRGYFASRVVRPNDKKNNYLVPPHCAHWLNPTERWFSLPMYLVSRYELALWAAFHDQEASPTVLQQQPHAQELQQQERTHNVRLSRAALKRALASVVFPKDRNQSLIRDCLIFRLLEQPQQPWVGSTMSGGTISDEDIGNSVGLLDCLTCWGELHTIVAVQLQEEMSKEMEKSLMRIENDQARLPLPKQQQHQQQPQQRSSKRKRSKRKKRKGKSNISTTVTHPPTLKEEEVLSDSDNENDDSERNASTTNHVRFQDTQPPSMEQTRKVIMVLSILDNVMESVFERVGLVVDPPPPSPAPRPLPPHPPSDKVESSSSLTNHHSVVLDPILPSLRESHPFETIVTTNHSNAATTPPPNENAISPATSFSYFSPNLMAPSESAAALSEQCPLLDPFQLPGSFAYNLNYGQREESVFANVFLMKQPDDDEDAATSVQALQLDQDSNADQRLSPPRSPSPPVPETPSPQLSPLLVSLADLQKMRQLATNTNNSGAATAPAIAPKAFVTGSLPNSPVQFSSVNAAETWSHNKSNHHRMTTDDSFPLQNSKRKPTRQTTGSSMKSLDGDRSRLVGKRDMTTGLSVPDLDPVAHKMDGNLCAQSETALDTHEVDDFWQDRSSKGLTTSNTECSDHLVALPTKDDPTAVSGLSQHRESDEVVVLREERNTFRDMCLTLGAEVAKLKNLLATQQAELKAHHHGIESPGAQQQQGHASSDVAMYKPEFTPPFFHGISKATSTIATMSDVGIHRDHESTMSEEGMDVGVESVGRPTFADKRMSSSATLAGSDVSVEQRPLNLSEHAENSLRDAFGAVPLHGAQSRLTKDIVKFVNTTRNQLDKEIPRRSASIEHLSRLVTALWPRAQVKLYGSHATGLALPSSDLDIVICLPAVHKNAPAVAPGALEGRNAINESSQKLLARKLKGESWIVPRSIKVIERTVIPVIKVSTKDTRARTLHLDISFDGPVHHGLEAIQMVNEVIQEMPMVRPLVLVLKQLLLDRGLRTAYTGGLSSYCLFLMVARYLQEQPSSWGDCGSLLMGFLDFYGNSFDPRATGISVSRRQYFSRNAPHQAPWSVKHQQRRVPTKPASPSTPKRPDFLRRHSFTDKQLIDQPAGPSPLTPQSTHTPRPFRFQPTGHHRFIGRYPRHADGVNMVHLDGGDKPYTFDPLFVEDPLSVGNNVGRNAFRIFQVQRAFSDAHRTLVASLEWEHSSTGDLNNEADYPLLQCLLHSEDVFYDFEDPNR